MSELYKAMKRIEDYKSTKPLYKQIAEIKGIASTARYGYDIQPQLTIPKNIVGILGKFEEFKSSAVAYAWFVWEKGYQGRPEIDWIN